MYKMKPKTNSEKLRALAEWFDAQDNIVGKDPDDNEVQRDLRAMATEFEQLQQHNVSGGLPDYQTLINFLESTKLKHHISDDCWYSCPMSDEGCCNHEEKGCNCGAEAHNKKIDDFIKQHLGKPEQ